MEIADPVPAIAAILEIPCEMRGILGLSENCWLVAQVIDLVGKIISDQGCLSATGAFWEPFVICTVSCRKFLGKARIER